MGFPAAIIMPPITAPKATVKFDAVSIRDFDAAMHLVIGAVKQPDKHSEQTRFNTFS